MNERIPLYRFYLKQKENQAAGEVYLGAILAAVLFFSFFFGSFLFFVIVLIISVFIFLSRDENVGDEEGNVLVTIYRDGLDYGSRSLSFKDFSSVSKHDALLGEEAQILRLVFKDKGRQNLYLKMEEEVQGIKIYDIIRASVREDRIRGLSLAEQILIRFF